MKHEDQPNSHTSIALPSLALTHLSAPQDYESKLSALKQEVTDLATASEAVQAKNAEWGTTILAQSKVLDSLLTTNASSKNAKERTAAAKKAIVDLKKKLKAATTKGKAASTALTTVQKKHDRSSTSPKEEMCQDNKQEMEVSRPH